MRSLLVVAVFSIGTGVLMAQDDAQDNARDAVTKAIKATGLEGKAIPKGIRWKTKFTIDTLDKELEFLEVKVFQTTKIRFPFQITETREATVLSETETYTTGYDGKNAWIKSNGMVNDEKEIAKLEEYKEMPNVFEATHLLTPLLDKKKYTLKETGMKLVDGRRAFEVRVSREGYRNMKLYFDYKTKLLVKMERKGRDPRTGVECKETRLYRSYQKMEGRMVPGSVAHVVNGELVYDMQTLDYAELNDIHASEFARPKE